MRRQLRPHQERAITLLRQSLGRGFKRPILQAPTGAGKSFIAATIVKSALEKGNRVAFVVPAISLINQTVAEFQREGITDIGVLQASHPMTNYDAAVQVCSVQTIAKRVMPEFDLLINDEAHLQFKVIKRLMDRFPSVPFIGLSATPWTKGLGKNWDDLLIAATTRELIDAGYLSDYTVYAPHSPDLSGVKVTAGDYQQDQLSAVMRDHKLVGDIVQSWLQIGTGDKTLCFAVDRAHAKAIQMQFKAHGIKFGYCDANTDIVEREFLFGQMQKGEIAGIVNVGTLTTGVDTDVRTLILARPTKSESLYVQIVGRALRPAHGKQEAIIIDHSDTTLRLGLPCAIVKDRLCDGEKQEVTGTRDREPPKPKACPKCKTVKPAGVHACPKCSFAPELIRDVEAAPGELKALNGKAKPKATKEDKQSFYSMALWVARDRGYKRGWAANKYREKFKVWPRGLDDVTAPPDQAFKNFETSQRIAYAKRKRK